MLSDEKKQTIEYLKARLYGNEGCKFIDVAQSDLRIFLKLVENLQKDIENWEKYCNEQENDITLKNNKICDLEFKIEKQSKEIEELKENILIHQEYNKGYFQGRRDERDETDDHIKAKIEEYDDKGMTINLTNRSAGKTFQQAVHYEVKKVLQSLLEKE